jgi:hypothetical protein
MLDSKLLNKYAFKKLKQITIYDSFLGGIDDSLFYDFESIDTILLRLTNFKMFFKSAEWINFLNMSALANQNRQILIGFVDNNLIDRYTYPDADLCLFKNFPHSLRVFAYVSSEVAKYECTCTLLYLLKNWQAYKGFNISNPSIENCLKSDFFNSTYQNCNLEENVFKW